MKGRSAAAHLLVCIGCSLALGVGSARAQEGIFGRWEGEVRVSGQTMGVAVVLDGADGSLQGTLDIQGRTGLPLVNVRLEGNAVHFELAVGGTVAEFDGTRAGDAIRGTFRQAGEGTFVLTRVLPVELDAPIRSIMEERHIPGLAAAAVRDGSVVWVGTYGLAEVETGRRVTRETVFFLASVSKTVTATALMKLHGEGRFGLDDDVSDYLPFPLRNPGFPTEPITFAHLLRHRSSVRDNMAYYGPFWSEARGDQDIALGDYLRAYLDASGEHYDPDGNFFPETPGSEFHYCNTCYALLGYLAERISGRAFQEHVEESLFRPLAMDHSSWFYRDTDADRVAVGYRYSDDAGFEAYDPVGYPDWPAGQLRSTIDDMAEFVATYTRFGRVDDAAVVDSTTVELMAPRHLALGSFTWFRTSFEGTGRVLYTHAGGDLGARTMVGFDPATRNGFVVLSNGEAAVDDVAALVFGAIPTLGW